MRGWSLSRRLRTHSCGPLNNAAITAAKATDTLAASYDALTKASATNGTSLDSCFTQAGAQSYIDTLLQVPHRSPTQFDTPGLSAAQAGIDTFKASVDGLTGKNIPINIFGSFSIAPNGDAVFGNLAPLAPSSGPAPAPPGIPFHADGGRITGPVPAPRTAPLRVCRTVSSSSRGRWRRSTCRCWRR